MKRLWDVTLPEPATVFGVGRYGAGGWAYTQMELGSGMTIDLFGSRQGVWVSGMSYCSVMEERGAEVVGEMTVGFDVTGARDRLWGRLLWRS